MQNSSLRRKLNQYATFMGSFIAASGFAEGQVRYTDVHEDVFGSKDCIALDLNHDDIVDFTISVHASFGANFESNNIHISPAAGNFVANTPSIYPEVLDQGENIDSDLDWRGGPSQTLAFWTQSWIPNYGSVSSERGRWGAQDEKFLALKFLADGKQYYGWARLSVSYWAEHVLIHDYACEMTPGSSITTGEPGRVSRADAGMGFLSILPNPSDGKMTIHATFQQRGPIIMKVFDSVGKELYAENLDQVTGDFSKQIDLSNLSEGIYLLQIIHDGKIQVKKIMIEN